jgi:hypothetical protein
MLHVWGTGEVHTGVWWGNLRKRDHLKDLDIDGRKILIPIFKKCDRVAWTRLIWLRIGTGGGFFECANKPQGSIKTGEFLD